MPALSGRAALVAGALLLAGLLFLLSLTPTPARADPGDVDTETAIRNAAAQYDVDANRLLALAWCESRLDPNAVGDGGKSAGLFQLHERGLFLWTPWAHLGLEARRDPVVAARVAAWAWARGLRRHWTCAR